MATVNDIMSRTSTAVNNSSRAADSVKEARDASGRMQSGIKFDTLAEADEAGVRKVIDGVRQDLVFLERYDTNIKIVSPKINDQLRAINDIQQTMVEFSRDDGGRGTSGQTREQIGNKALSKIQKILERRVNGEFMFGGKHSKINPVKFDLTVRSNLINGQSTSIFTDSASDNSKLEISDEQEVKVNNVFASDEVIVEAIGMLNFYKQNDAPTTLQAKNNNLDKLFSKRIIEIGNERVKIQTSIDVNNRAEDITNTILTNTEGINIIDESNIFSNALAALGVNFSITQAMNNAFAQIARAV